MGSQAAVVATAEFAVAATAFAATAVDTTNAASLARTPVSSSSAPNGRVKIWHATPTHPIATAASNETGTVATAPPLPLPRPSPQLPRPLLPTLSVLDARFAKTPAAPGYTVRCSTFWHTLPRPAQYPEQEKAQTKEIRYK